MNTVSSNIVLKKGIWKVIFVIGALQTVAQFCTVKYYGIVMYPFLNFSDGHKTWMWVAVLWTVPGLFYQGLCLVDEKLKSKYKRGGKLI